MMPTTIKEHLDKVVSELPKAVVKKMKKRKLKIFIIDWDLPPSYTKADNTIYLPANLSKLVNDAGIDHVIAHEIAHFVLGHDFTEHEKEANNLAAEWGFPIKHLQFKKAKMCAACMNKKKR